MIKVRYAVRGNHTHIEVRTGKQTGHLALAGNLIIDNGDDADWLLDNLVGRGHEPTGGSAAIAQLTPEGEAHWRTKTGKLLSDADIQALADEAERGYDVSNVQRVSRWHSMHAEQLEAAGWHIDRTTHPWVAYRGHRYDPTVWFNCMTPAYVPPAS